MDDGPEFLGLDDVPFSVADEGWYAGHRDEYSANGRPEEPGEPIRVDTFGEFGREDEEPPETLLGTREESILPEDGILMLYGDGGAGKTTLTIDGVAHLAGARNWLGLEVGRSVRSLMIENEGPRAMFRDVLRRKLASFGDPTIGDRLSILSEPWGEFTLSNVWHRAELARIVAEREAEIVTLGPLATVGTVGGGTPDEISAFQALLLDVRTRVGRPLSFWIVHHENKAGDVSGAWERVPDTLVHVQAAGNGHTRLVFRKARWSSEFHGRSLSLTWSEGRTFDVVEDVARDYFADVLELFESDDDWRTYKEVATLAKCRPGEAKSALAELTRRGDLMFEIGPRPAFERSMLEATLGDDTVARPRSSADREA